MDTHARITITDENLERLRRLIDQHSFVRDIAALDFLEQELGRAKVVPATDVPPSVVTMNSRVLFEDEMTGAQRIVQLAYPTETNRDPERISVFAPVGIALLGLHAGESIDFPMPGGKSKRLKVVAVLYQPEADRQPPPRAA